MNIKVNNKFLLFGTILLILFFGCSSSQEIDQRLQHYFNIPTNDKISSETIQSAILKDLPKGTSAQEIYSYLDKNGLGKDKLSSYYPVNQAGEIVCRIEFKPKTFDLVKKSYVIIFILENNRLKSVDVKENLTGL